MLNSKFVFILSLFLMKANGLPKILVGLGLTDNGVLDSFEIIDLDKNISTCSVVPNFPLVTYGVIGFVADNKVQVCGGLGKGPNDISEDCYALQDNKWIKSGALNQKRAYAAVAPVGSGQFVVSGGSFAAVGEETISNSSELFTGNKFEKSIPDLPTGVYFHCMANINSTAVILIGGVSPFVAGLKSYIYNLESKVWTDGPSSNQTHYHHSCGRIRTSGDSDEYSVIVVGGVDGSGDPSISKSLILDSDAKEWRDGPELARGLLRSALVEDDKGGVLMVGGQEDSQTVGTIQHLEHAKGEWKQLPQKLKTARSFHVAVKVSNDIAKCT